MNKNFESIFSAPAGEQTRPRQVLCALCEEEFYPGDRYFALEGRKICEKCLGIYARRYFIGQLQRIPGVRGVDDV